MRSSIPDNQKIEKKRGRPATGRKPMQGVRMDDEMLNRIEAWREAHPDQPSRAEAMRLLMLDSLDRNGA